jgi:hypothetical protein
MPIKASWQLKLDREQRAAGSERKKGERRQKKVDL